APVEIDPFAIVAFTNRSDYAMLEIAGAAKDEILLAPAIFLKYAEDKESNANAIEATAIAVDIVALVTGPGIIISAIQAGRKALAVYEVLQFLGASANLYANQNTSPEFTEAVQMYNMIVGVWGLSRIATSGVRYTVDYISSVRNGDVQAVSTATAQNYIHKFDQITNWNGVSESTKVQMRRMRELLGKNVASSAIIASTQFSRAVINGLTGFVNRITSLAAQYSLTLTEFIALEGKSAAALSPAELATMNAMRNTIPHPNAATIMQKAIPKSDIGKYLDGTYTSCRGFMSTAEDSKHLETFEDIYYGMRLDYTNTAFNLSDGSCGVIRFKAANSASATIPKSVANQGTITNDMPFTGHGFTSGNNGRLGVPEWKMDNFALLENGAELWEVFSDGSEVLRGRYDKRILKFVAVN
ncbi:MAG TPA: hypothetical protein VK826_07515, partial [Bacteroidia bacterium]|nr:hypothetical protein [Bacteroidia bacterium]